MDQTTVEVYTVCDDLLIPIGIQRVIKPVVPVGGSTL